MNLIYSTIALSRPEFRDALQAGRRLVRADSAAFPHPASIANFVLKHFPIDGDATTKMQTRPWHYSHDHGYESVHT